MGLPGGRCQGSSLATTLMVIAIAVGLAFTLVGLGFHHLNLGNRLSHTQQARNLAEAAITKTMERIFKSDGAFGQAQETVTATFADAPGASGLVTFDPVMANTENVQRSTYNLGKDTPTTSPSGRTVPKQSVHLVGTGRCQGVERRIEAIVHIPTFKSALSCEADLVAKGPMVVASAAQTNDLLPKPEDHLADLLPAHVTSNRSGDLTGPVDITGMCQAMGSIITAGTPIPHVRGGLRPNSERAAIPHLDVNDFDPALLGKTHALTGPDSNNNWSGDGLLKMPPGDVVGDKLILPNGATKEGAIVFVQGDLKVKSIQGTGAVIATGDIIISEADETTLKTDNAVALLAKGNLSITGTGRNLAYIQGLAYAGKSLTVNKVTVVGALVQAGSNPGDQLYVEDANCIHSEQGVAFEFSMPFQAGGGTGFNIKLKNTISLVNFYDALHDRYAKLKVGATPPYTYLDYQPDRLAARSDLQLSPFGPADSPGTITALLADPNAVAQLQAVAASNPLKYPPVSYPMPGSEQLVLDDLIQGSLDGLNDGLRKIEIFYEKFNHESKDKGKVSFDPNRFLTLSESARVKLWKDL